MDCNAGTKVIFTENNMIRERLGRLTSFKPFLFVLELVSYQFFGKFFIKQCIHYVGDNAGQQYSDTTTNKSYDVNTDRYDSEQEELPEMAFGHFPRHTECFTESNITTVRRNHGYKHISDSQVNTRNEAHQHT